MAGLDRIVEQITEITAGIAQLRSERDEALRLLEHVGATGHRFGSVASMECRLCARAQVIAAVAETEGRQ